MSALFLTEDHVRDLLDMPMAIEVIEELFRELSNGRAKNVPRQRVQAGKMLLHTMSAACEYLGVGGWKAYSTTREKSRFHVGLYDLTTGEVLASGCESGGEVLTAISGSRPSSSPREADHGGLPLPPSRGYHH